MTPRTNRIELSMRTEYWHGRARLGIGWGLFEGRTGDNSAHAHHALQILLAPEPQQVWTEAHAWRACHGAVLGPNLRHRLDSGTQAVALLFVEPDSAPGRRLRTTLVDGWRGLDEATAAQARAQLAAESPAQAVADAICPPSPGAALTGDALIETLIDGLPRDLAPTVRVAEIARQAGLSPSRLQHRFRAHTGMALRPYLRWRRLLTALEAVTRGRPLTDAALEGGFADAAHFTRTFRRHFGITPRQLQRMHWST